MIVALFICAKIFHFSAPWYIWLIAAFEGFGTRVVNNLK